MAGGAELGLLGDAASAARRVSADEYGSREKYRVQDAHGNLKHRLNSNDRRSLL